MASLRSRYRSPNDILFQGRIDLEHTTFYFTNSPADGHPNIWGQMNGQLACVIYFKFEVVENSRNVIEQAHVELRFQQDAPGFRLLGVIPRNETQIREQQYTQVAHLEPSIQVGEVTLSLGYLQSQSVSAGRPDWRVWGRLAREPTDEGDTGVEWTWQRVDPYKSALGISPIFVGVMGCPHPQGQFRSQVVMTARPYRWWRKMRSNAFSMRFMPPQMQLQLQQ